jgi:hypothetical protein
MQTADALTIPNVRGLVRILVVVAVTFLSAEVAAAAESKRGAKPAAANAVATPTPILDSATPPASEDAPAQTATPATPPLEGVKVIDVYKLGNTNEKEIENRNSARLQEIIVVTVRNLENLTKTSKCLSKEGRAVPNCNPQAIALFLDGRLIKGIVPETGAPQINQTSNTATDLGGTLQFHLQRNADSDEAWADLLGAPPSGKGFFKRPTEVSVGLENGYALPTDIKVPATDLKHQFLLVRIDQWWFIFCLILLVAVLVFMVFLSWYSELLRDLGPVPPTDVDPNASWWQTWWRDRKKRKHKPYSLARFQMAFWFFLLMASFLFIWLITGASDTITGSTLALIGIGAGTALGAAAIDVTKEGDGGAIRPISVSQGFLTDVLSDRVNGISFHRFQMLVWTLVLGVLFIYSVWYRLSMPEFSATLLALLGISSGTYLGFKIPENQNPPAKTE